ncbi:MAG: class I SAM-dependent methyltransferase [Prolixibacteraceae bacterium]|nr:class I SAM-dependent methyltransferase [Burkholderiales bacterium]
MNPYRLRVWEILQGMASTCGVSNRVLDFGSGDGWFASRFLESKLVRELVPVDVKRRDKVFVEPVIYSGEELPFAAREFDLVYAVDVLHHCPDPMKQLHQLATCSSRYLLLKDHVYFSQAGRLTLAVLDELGNRKFGIPSLYQYQRDWEWHRYLLANGWKLNQFDYPARCHIGILGAVTNGLQYAALYERQ